MKITPEESSLLASKIIEADAKLEELEKKVIEIGLPAGQELRRRLDALKVEERALKRNFEESMRRGEPDEVRIEKIEALLRHIETEEKSMETDVHFLHEANPSSVTLAVEASQQMVDLYRRGLKKVIGDSQPLGESVFVNHTHQDIEREHGKVNPPSDERGPDER